MRYGFLLISGFLGSCAQVSDLGDRLLRPADRDAAGDPLAAPIEVEAVPEAEVVEVAALPPAVGGTATTIVSLGDPARAGAWLETPLGLDRTAGRGSLERQGIVGAADTCGRACNGWKPVVTGRDAGPWSAAGGSDRSPGCFLTQFNRSGTWPLLSGQTVSSARHTARGSRARSPGRVSTGRAATRRWPSE